MKKLLLILPLTLCGCDAYNKAVEARHDSQCQSYGLKFGTTEYAQCRIQLKTSQDQNLAIISHGMMSGK